MPVSATAGRRLTWLLGFGALGACGVGGVVGCCAASGAANVKASNRYRMNRPVRENKCRRNPPWVNNEESNRPPVAYGVALALVLAHGDDRWALGRPISIGRLYRGDSILAGDKVSRRHVRVHGNGPLLVDSSRHGTLVNGEQKGGRGGWRGTGSTSGRSGPGGRAPGH